MTKALALVTCKRLPQLSDDDHLLTRELERAGISYEIAVWNDPAVDWRRFGAILIRSPWDYPLHPELFIDWLKRVEESGVPLINDVSLIRWNIEKTYLRELERKGAAIVPTLWVNGEPLEATKQELDRLGWREVVIKPALSADALHTYRINRMESADEFAHACAKLAKRPPVMIQPYLPEVASEGEWSLMYFGGDYSHAIIKKPAQGDYRVQKTHGGSYASATPPPEAFAASEKILAAIPGRWLYARVDLIRVGGEFLLGELEIIEPSLFFGYDVNAAPKFVKALERFLK